MSTVAVLLSQLYGRPHKCLLVAHRGVSDNILENSYASFSAVNNLPIDVVETDVRSTLDGVAVVLHDPDFGRVSPVQEKISELTWDEVSKIVLADGSHPLKLVDLLADFSEVFFNIDMKDQGAVNGVYQAIQDADAQDRVCVASFSNSRLKQFRRLCEGKIVTSLSPWEVVRLKLLSSLRIGTSAAGLNLRCLRKFVISTPSEISSRVLAVQVPLRSAFNLLPLVTPAFVALAHNLGLDVHVWTINDMEIARRLISGPLGIDAIMTDYAEDVARVMGRL